MAKWLKAIVANYDFDSFKKIQNRSHQLQFYDLESYMA